MIYHQRTIKNEVECVGIGLHTGEQVRIRLHPACEDSGIVFRRTDISEKNPYVPASYQYVSNTMLGTTLTNPEKIKVGTIEHLMAAFWGCGIDNCLVDIDGEEVPIMDGSSEPFVFMLECAGVKEQKKSRRIIEVLKEVRVSEGEGAGAGYAAIVPSEDFSVSLEIDFGDSVIARQQCRFDSRDVSFKSDLCRARTFGFAHEVDKLREMGLARGGSLDNAVVIGAEGVMNKGGLRYQDEFVRHKVLDCIGDVYLAGAYLKGHFHGFKSGHGLNNRLLRAFFEDKSAWRVLKFPEKSDISGSFFADSYQ